MATAADVRRGLRSYYASAEWALAFEVANGTGAHARRHLDAVAMNLWPSRGNALHGIEIKVSKGDLRREIAQPEKADAVAKYMDFFWIAAPKGLADADGLPLGWGLLELLEDGKMRVKRQARHADAVAMTRPFVAALLRASQASMEDDEVAIMLAAERAKMAEAVKTEVERELSFRREARGGKAESWDKLVEAIGRDPGQFWADATLIGAVKAVMKADVAGTYGSLRRLRDVVAAAAVGLAAIDLDVAAPEVIQAKRRHA